MKYAIVCLNLLLLAPFAQAQSGRSDPAFEKIPFERWLSEPETMRIRWSIGVTKPEFTFHQRLAVTFDIRVDGKDLESRRDNGSLVFFLEITAPDGSLYRSHGQVDLSKLDDHIRSANLQYQQSAFVLPGKYRIAAAALETSTGEHTTRRGQFAVAAPQQLEKLAAEAWADLPAIEFLGHQDPPESWFQPSVTGRVRWGAGAALPARLAVVVNIATSAPVPGRRQRAHPNEGEALIPALKLMAPAGANAEVLDLTHRHVVFRHRNSAGIDWPGLRDAITEGNAKAIDVKTLSDRHHDARFFILEIRKVLSGPEPPAVLVVLSPHLTFDSGEDLEPISREGLAPCRIFYIRYQARVVPEAPVIAPMGRRGRFGAPPPLDRRMSAMPQDQLAATLKPFAPKVIDVSTPDQMFHALAEVEKALQETKR